jgi:hypothetical protein
MLLSVEDIFDHLLSFLWWTSLHQVIFQNKSPHCYVISLKFLEIGSFFSATIKLESISLTAMTMIIILTIFAGVSISLRPHSVLIPPVKYIWYEFQNWKRHFDKQRNLTHIRNINNHNLASCSQSDSIIDELMDKFRANF